MIAVLKYLHKPPPFQPKVIAISKCESSIQIRSLHFKIHKTKLVESYIKVKP